MVVDWSKPIEAVHEDGRVENAYQYREGAVWPDYQGQYHVGYGNNRDLAFVNSDGSPWKNNKITVRNTATPATTPPIPAPIAERMRGLIERMAGADGLSMFDGCRTEARAIMAELVPVSVDTLEAQAALLRWQSDPDGNLRDHFEEAIRKGRELQKDGK